MFKLNINTGVADDIARAGQLAAVLEVCGWPKPGNVHRTADFTDTTFEHFMAGSIAIGPALRNAALKGMKAGFEEINMRDIELGSYIKQAVLDARRWHTGGNTHLGISLLLTPLAAAAGLSYAKFKKIKQPELRKCVKEVIGSTTPQDAAYVYDAISAVSGSWVGKVCSERKIPDLADKNAERKLIEGKITLYDVMAYSSEWDSIAKEWVTGMQISFEVGCPTLLKIHDETGSMNVATVHTFLTILSLFPDTFIARKIGVRYVADVREAVKIGLAKAVEVSKRARDVLELGSLLTQEGRKALSKFDEDLRLPGNELNPGTSADLTASSLMIATLCGLRP